MIRSSNRGFWSRCACATDGLHTVVSEGLPSTLRIAVGSNIRNAATVELRIVQTVWHRHAFLEVRSRSDERSATTGSSVVAPGFFRFDRAVFSKSQQRATNTGEVFQTRRLVDYSFLALPSVTSAVVASSYGDGDTLERSSLPASSMAARACGVQPGSYIPQLMAGVSDLTFTGFRGTSCDRFRLAYQCRRLELESLQSSLLAILLCGLHRPKAFSPFAPCGSGVGASLATLIVSNVFGSIPFDFK